MMWKQIPAVIGACSIAFLGAATGQSYAPIALPADPAAAVITLDWRGAALFLPPGGQKNPNPPLSIRADGTIIVTDPAGVRGDLQARLSPTELQELLKFVVQEKDFFAIDGAAISSAIRAEEIRAGQGRRIFDAGEHLIRVKTADKEKEIRFYDLGFYAGLYPSDRFPSMKALADLHAIQLKLTRIETEIKERR
jgi:hypothetical protein